MTRHEGRYTGPLLGKYIDDRLIIAAMNDGGKLMRALPGYRPRADQIDLSMEMAHALNQHTSLYAEIGTGRGKSVAIGVNAALYEGPIIISTSNIALQHQLADAIQRVAKALDAAVPPPLVVKGRSHRICIARLHDAEGDDLLAADHLHQYLDGRGGHGGTMGDIDLFPEVAGLDRGAVGRLSAARSCLGDSCVYWDDCPVHWVADIAAARPTVIVNHALLASWITQRERTADSEGYRWLSAAPVIIDEAHQLPRTVEDALTLTLDIAGMISWLDGIAGQWVPRDVAVPALRALTRLGAALHNQIGGDADTDHPLERVVDVTAGDVSTLVVESRDALDMVRRSLPRRPRRAKGSMRALLAHRVVQDSLTGNLATLDRLRRDPGAFYVDVARSTPGITVSRIPLFPGSTIRRALDGPAIALSATLSTGPDGDMRYMMRQYGVHRDDQAHTFRVPSAFDYAKVGRLLIPRGLPVLQQDPLLPIGRRQAMEAAYLAARLPVAEQLIRAARGRALLLFTSRHMMQMYHDHLVAALEADGIECRLTAAGDAGERQALLSWLRAAPLRVLMGSRAFWEGIDLAGDDLILVIIDKVPYPRISSDILAARSEALDRLERDEPMAGGVVADDDEGNEGDDRGGREAASDLPSVPVQTLLRSMVPEATVASRIVGKSG